MEDRLKSQLQREEDKMTEQDVLSQVKQLTGAEDAQVAKKITESVWSILLAFPDGPGAYTFQNRLVDVTGEAVRLLGMNF
jgi:hypothetical protein